MLAEGLYFGEGPRWRAGWLYFSDFYDHAVKRVDLDGNVEIVVEVPNQPSGLGWLPDGRMLIVSMLDRKLLRHEPDGSLAEHADLSDIATFHCNDMVVDAHGRAYVGNFGFDLDGILLSPVLQPSSTLEFVEEVLPLLRARGVLADAYREGETLRERLTGSGSPVLPRTHPAAAHRHPGGDRNPGGG